MSDTGSPKSKQASLQREWIERFLPFANKNKYPITVVSFAWAMFEFYFNRKTGQCDPGLDELAAKAGCDPSSADRAVRLLKDDGWLQLKRGGNGENAQLTPTLSDRTISVLFHRRAERRAEAAAREASASAQTPAAEASKSGVRSLKVGGQKPHHGAASIRTLNTEHSERGPTAARSDRVDREGPCHNVTNGSSAPDGASALEEIIATLPERPNAPELNAARDVTREMAALGYNMQLVVADFQQYPLKQGASLVSALNGMLQAPKFFMTNITIGSSL